MSDDDKAEPAFPVEDTGEDYGADLPPTTANEYLRRVQIEASNCPNVVVAKLDTSKFLVKQTVPFINSNDCPPPPEGFAPSRGWQRKQVYNFHLAREATLLKRNKEKSPVKLPRISEKDRWKDVLCGSASPSVHPLVSVVTTIPQQTIEAVISYSAEWIEEEGFCASMSSKDDPDLLPLNLMICLIACYFNQTDLADK
ncbi:hypothetical protein HPB51_015898 [Rhipicephalus microplus]|uniref:Gem-associated protein 2 n=1 Tax=Rhipicephalus microplus TaxID=6941 RepID=A0A9J6DHZ5_RHIMP|nr:hypothetical protein HPB51_015898 [Rhipicephalus microplus]